MRRLFLFLILVGSVISANAWPKAKFSGMYLQWGYNRDVYSRSDLHFSNGDQYNFTIHQAKAVDQPDFRGFWETPLDITIPQNSYRIGFYLNADHSSALEINFDHAKYVVNDEQYLRVSGQIHGEPIDQDTIIYRHFVHFEHTNGANFYHINYVRQKFLIEGKNFGKLSYVLKGGAGVVVPRSDVTIMDHRLDNKYHVAGYIVSAEAGLRYYPWRNFFLELNAKGGFANYLNVLTVEGGKAHHHFWYGEMIGLIGYDLNLGHPRVRPEATITPASE